METLMLLLATSGLLRQSPPPLVPDSLSAVAAPMTWTPADSASASTAPVGPVERLPLAPLQLDFYGALGAPQRPRAVEVSEAYHVRLTIHKIASFATVPLFVAEYIVGRKLYTSLSPSQSDRQLHSTIASGVAGLFAVNTVTGAWNLWDSRKTPQGALRRYLHSGLMFLADAGFVATGLTAPHGRRILPTASARSRHQTIAVASMGTALASYAMMIFWKD